MHYYSENVFVFSDSKNYFIMTQSFSGMRLTQLRLLQSQCCWILLGISPRGQSSPTERGALEKVGMEGPALGTAALRARRVSSQQRTLSVPFSPWEHPLSVFLQRKPDVGCESTPLPACRGADTAVLLPQGPASGAGSSGQGRDRPGSLVMGIWGQLGMFWTSQGDRQALVEAAHQGKGYCQLGFSILPSLFPVPAVHLNLKILRVGCERYQPLMVNGPRC